MWWSKCSIGAHQQKACYDSAPSRPTTRKAYVCLQVPVQGGAHKGKLSTCQAIQKLGRGRSGSKVGDARTCCIISPLPGLIHQYGRMMTCTSDIYSWWKPVPTLLWLLELTLGQGVKFLLNLWGFPCRIQRKQRWCHCIGMGKCLLDWAVRCLIFM